MTQRRQPTRRTMHPLERDATNLGYSIELTLAPHIGRTVEVLQRRANETPSVGGGQGRAIGDVSRPTETEALRRHEALEGIEQIRDDLLALVLIVRSIMAYGTKLMGADAPDVELPATCADGQVGKDMPPGRHNPTCGMIQAKQGLCPQGYDAWRHHMISLGKWGNRDEEAA